MRKRFLGLVATFVGMIALACGAVAEDTMNADAFTKAFATEMAKLMPGFEVRQTEQLTLDVTGPDGIKYRVSLDNAFRSYQADTTSFVTIVDGYAAYLKDVPKDDEGDLTVDKIVALVRPRDLALAANENPADDPTVTEPLTSQLDLLYAFDHPGGFAFLTERKRAGLAIAKGDLRSLAIKNLRKLNLNARVEVLDGAALVGTDGPYVTSFLLFDEFWDDTRFAFKGELLVFPVNRELMIVTGSKEEKGYPEARSKAHEMFETLDHPISNQPIVRRNASWVQYQD
jgi:uncharacterized protein YtpQ (UPF0354 family)